jgi:hypothetical protein
MTQTRARHTIDKLLAALPELGDTLRGSLLRRRTFHPSAISCATCSSGKGHSQWVLNVNYPAGKTRQLSVHPQQVARVRQQLRNLDRVRKTLERVCEINQRRLRAERKQLREQEHD